MRSCFTMFSASKGLRLGRFVLLGLTLALGACGDDGGRGTSPGTDMGPTRNDLGPPMCETACEGGTVCCGSACVNTSTNNLNCGGCGIACNSSQACMGGSCVPLSGIDAGPGLCSPTCASSQRCCGTTCVNKTGSSASDSSFQNCGACGFACNPERSDRCGQLAGSSVPQCLCGTSNLECSGGRVCVEDSGVMICADLQNSTEHCGSVGNACAEGETCFMGACGCGTTGAACGDGEACCDGACIDVTSDAANCGGCGMECGILGPDCVDSQCRCGSSPACTGPTAGMLGGPGDPGESCCGGSCVANTTESCLCEPCTGGDTCQVGSGLLGGEVQVCCGDESVAIAGCGGFGFDLGI